jgi:hypothetical protein
MNKLQVLSKIALSKIRALKSDFSALEVPKEVEDALAIQVKDLKFDLNAVNQAIDWGSLKEKKSPSSEEIFTNPSGQRYPCWVPGDESLGDDWLLCENYYPYYHRIYELIGKEFPETKLLEFGVRSGYSGVVFAKAIKGKKTYFGVDPNLYIDNGLGRAKETFLDLKSEHNLLEFFLLEGFSSSTSVQKTLSYSGPFEVIHVDGEHTYFGKLFDLWIAKNLVSKNGYVLVDDFNHHGMIHDSVKVACYLGWFKAFTFVDTKRGLAVLKTQ